MVVGFSTGSLALGNVRLGLQMVEGHATAAVELSALREEELIPLIESLDDLDLSGFSYVSLHAPSRLKTMSESEAVRLLRPVAERGWPVIVHPDVVGDSHVWRTLGDRLCIENMDKRKSTGRTAHELAGIFAQLSEATLCFDLGHARQIDPTMCEADAILRQFVGRLRQIHLSLVNSQGGHEPLNYESMLAFRRVSHLLPPEIPVILETPVAAAGIEKELEKVGWLIR